MAQIAERALPFPAPRATTATRSLLETLSFPPSEANTVPMATDVAPGPREAEHASRLNRALIERVKQTLQQFSGTSLAQEELLCFILSLVFDLDEAVLVSRNLIGNFGSLGEVMRASERSLAGYVHSNTTAIAVLHCLYELTRSVLVTAVRDRPVLTTTLAVRNYLRFALTTDNVETIRVLFLDSYSRLISDELSSRGDANSVGLHPVEIGRRMLALASTGIIVVHYRPNRDIVPTPDEIGVGRHLQSVCDLVRGVLHEIVFVGRDGCTELISSGLLA